MGEKTKGFTLIEVMIVALLIGIAAMWARPSIQSYNKNTVLLNATREFIRVVDFARTEAIRTKGNVAIETDSIINDDFSENLSVCKVSAAVPVCTFEGRVKVVNVGRSNVKLMTNFNSRIVFDARGRLVNRAPINVGVCYSPDTVDLVKRYITISPTGRATSQPYNAIAGHLCDPV